MIYILLLLIRFLFVFKQTKIDFDTYGHIYFSKEVNKQKAGPFGSIKLKVIGNESFSHPFLWHYFVGKISTKFLINYGKWINLLLDTLFGIFLYFICVNTLAYSSNISALVITIYFYSPLLFSSLSIGPRLKNLTPRIISEIGLNLYFIFLLFSPIEILYVNWAIALFFGVVVFTSSKFGLQALLFLSPLVSLFSFNILPIVGLIFIYLISYIISKGKINKMINHQLIHLKWYYKSNKLGNMSISNRNSLKKLFHGIKEKTLHGAIKSLSFRLLRNNSYSVVILKLPIFIFVITYIFITLFNETLTYQYPIYGPVIAGLTLFILINFKRFLFLGEAERYLNHIISFVIFSLIHFLSVSNDSFLYYLTIGLLIYGIIFFILEVLFFDKLKDQALGNNVSECQNEIISLLQNSKKNHNILCFPLHTVGVYRIMLETGNNTLMHYMSSDVYLNKIKEITMKYPYFDISNFEKVYKLSGVDVIILDRSKLNNVNIKSLSIGKKWNKIELKFDSLELYIRN